MRLNRGFEAEQMVFMIFSKHVDASRFETEHVNGVGFDVKIKDLQSNNQTLLIEVKSNSKTFDFLDQEKNNPTFPILFNGAYWNNINCHYVFFASSLGLFYGKARDLRKYFKKFHEKFPVFKHSLRKGDFRLVALRHMLKKGVVSRIEDYNLVVNRIIERHFGKETIEEQVETITF
ncbi:Uncharacterised protein [uncultured archaeon]|nr:Uncharacterised protein [uncultured archaeon]